MRERGLHGFVARWNRAAWGKLVVVGCQAEEIRLPSVMISSRFSDGGQPMVRHEEGDSPAADQCLLTIMGFPPRRIGTRPRLTVTFHGSRNWRRDPEEETGERGGRRKRRRQKNGLDGGRRWREKGREMASVASVAHAWRRWGRCLAGGRVAFVRPRPSKVPARKQSQSSATVSARRSKRGVRGVL